MPEEKRLTIEYTLYKEESSNNSIPNKLAIPLNNNQTILISTKWLQNVYLDTMSITRSTPGGRGDIPSGPKVNLLREFTGSGIGSKHSACNASCLSRWGWEWYGGDNNVKSYSYSSRDFSKSPVSQISYIPATVIWTVSNQNTRSNVAYDRFRVQDIKHPTSGSDYELMIWLACYGGVVPIGSRKSTVNLGGRSWELWVGYNSSKKVFSFVARSLVSNFLGDVKQFFNHLVSQEGFPAISQNRISESTLLQIHDIDNHGLILFPSCSIWYRTFHWRGDDVRCLSVGR